MGRTQMLKILVAAPDPDYPDDGYEVEEIRYLDGHEDAPRVCTCRADELLAQREREEQARDPDAVIWESPRDHLAGCPETRATLTDAEWAYEDIRNSSGPDGCADYLWGALAPPAGPRFWVVGYCWVERDYWGEYDGGFEFKGFEKWRVPT